ncbi:hypothetical protein ANS017_02340 [Paraclostridium bifermentans]|nr:hypothetical protein ANS014_26530 [Paraclostridium bifermentans]GKZ08511.1 hypothetical protein ANS015_33940 [Paraclostridium bifermentans]GKZ08850.1 hypothetical protein ANS017_02340 [Paraclostridium bifermentans]
MISKTFDKARVPIDCFGVLSTVTEPNKYNKATVEVIIKRPIKNPFRYFIMKLLLVKPIEENFRFSISLTHKNTINIVGKVSSICSKNKLAKLGLRFKKEVNLSKGLYMIGIKNPPKI